MLSYLLRIELRRQWRRIALLALLVAVVAATVLSSAAGARRSRSAFDRYLVGLNAPEVLAFGDPDALNRIGDLPFVEAVASLELAAVIPKSAPENSFFPMAVSAEGLVPYRYFRAPVVAGRFADPTAPLEVTLGERTAARLDLEVGDTMAMESLSAAGAQELGSENGDPEFDGPAFSLDVVGIVREPGDLSSRNTDITFTFLTPAFREQFDHDEIGDIGRGAFVALKSPSDVTRLSDAMAGDEVEFDAIFSNTSVRRQINPTMDAIATALQVFAAVVLLAGLAAFAHAAGRMQLEAAAEDRVLSALGIDRATRWGRVVAPTATALVAGALLAPAVAVLASPLFPVGLARRAEPHLGVHVDSVVVFGGSALLGAVGLLVVAGLGLTAVRSSAGDATSPRITLGTRAGAVGAPPTVVAGLTMATSTRRGARSPAAAAVAGAALGVLGVLAAVVVAASTDRLVASHELYGWGWDANVAGANTSHLDDDALDIDTLVEDDDLTTVAILTQQMPLTLDSHPTQAMAAEDLKGHLEPVVVSGREPTGRNEIAIGRGTADEIGADVGTQVTARVGGTARPMTVVGIVALPVTEDGGASGVGSFLPAVAADHLGLDELCQHEDSSCFRNAAITVADGVDITEIVDRYEDQDRQVAVDLPTPPGEVERLVAVDNLPWFLAAFLAILAATAVTYAAAIAVRRRRRDLAVLRVVGMSAADLRTVVTVQVLSLTVAGAIIGSIGGLIAGRSVWRLVIDQLSLPFSPAAPILAIVLVPAAAIVLTQLAATSSRRAAGRTPAALILRSE